MRIAVLGRTHWLLDAAELCVADGHQIVLVATARASCEYRVGAEDFRSLAERNSSPFLGSGDKNYDAFLAKLRTAKADVAISVNWPRLFLSSATDILPYGILNAHAGDLPRYRGNACPNWGIINGEKQLGLCIHDVDPNGLDSGAVHLRRFLDNHDSLYIADVYAWMDETIPEAFVEVLRLLGTNGHKPEPQTERDIRPLRCHPRRPSDGKIDWNLSAALVQKLVRASGNPFAGAFSWLEGEARVIVHRARVHLPDTNLCAVPGQIMGRAEDGAVLVMCGQGVLAIEEAECEGRERLPGSNRFRLMDQLGL